MDNIQELREIVNPVFNTAKSCIQLVAGAGSGSVLKYPPQTPPEREGMLDSIEFSKHY